MLPKNGFARLIVCGSCALLLFNSTVACGQLILNEASAVGDDQFVQTDEDFACDKAYEGYDFGVHPYSGNSNGVFDPVPGNPFPADIDNSDNVFDPVSMACIDADPETTLPNGWSLKQATGFGRIQSNGGDWMELVVTDDHTDLRGYTLFWENDDNIDLAIGTNPEERGFIKFTDNEAFADLRAGTILTISERDSVAEIRDKFPDDVEFNLGGPDPHDTGHVYDLSTDDSFDPYSADDWHVHFHVDESLTDNGIATEYFEGFSDVKVDNDWWQMTIFDSTNTAVVEEAEDPGVMTISDLTTGKVQETVGEIPNLVSVNNQEMLTLRDDPTDATVSDYEDVDWSTFGSPNLYNDNTESTLDGRPEFFHLA